MDLFISLILIDLDSSISVLKWLESWWGLSLLVLEPKDWFYLRHDIVGWYHETDGVPLQILGSGSYLKMPSSAVADIVI